LRKTNVRRFRKVGSDEWLSFPQKNGDAYWESNFIKAEIEEAVQQATQNAEEVGGDINEQAVIIEDTAKEVKDSSSSTVVDSAVNKKRLLIGVALLAVAGFIGYKMFKKK